MTAVSECLIIANTLFKISKLTSFDGRLSVEKDISGDWIIYTIESNRKLYWANKGWTSRIVIWPVSSLNDAIKQAVLHLEINPNLNINDQV